MLDDQKQLLTQFFTLWAMLDPISHLPLFLGVTGDLSSQERRRADILAVVFAFFILIAGGIILLVFSISMVLGEPPSAVRSLADSRSDPLNVAVYPLATPIIAGPGSMLAIILHSLRRWSYDEADFQSIFT